MATATGVKSAVLLIAVLAGATGCAYHQVARPIPFEPGLLLGRVRGSRGVALINGQKSREAVEIGSAGLGRSLYGDLHQWTDAALDLLLEEFVSEGVSISDSSKRWLKLAITRADLGTTGGGWAFKCNVRIDVELGDGYAAAFEGERAGMRYVALCNAGITEALSNMLKDEIIRRYIAD